MPYRETKVKGGYKVTSPHGVKAKHTTKAKADAQIRLLQGIKHGWEPTGKKSKHHSAENGEFLDKRMSRFGVD